MPVRNATIRSKWLGDALLKIRKAAGLTMDEAAERMNWPASKLSRIENGLVRAHWGDVHELLDLYEFHDPEQRAALITLAKNARSRGWWHAYGVPLDHPFADLLSLEATCTESCAYEIQAVPGLLQTREYALALVGSSRMWERREDVERFVEVRTARQTVLTRDDPLRLWVILNEAVLRQHVGGPDVMRRQLRHLLELEGMPHLTIQVLPFAAGASTGSMCCPFTILKFPGPGIAQVVHLENLTGGLYLEQEDEVRRYMLAFDHLRASALPTRESMRFIAKAAQEL